MKWVIIGHRGVGKSNLLSRWKKYVCLTHETMRFFDLDREIETELGISITEYFIENSERAFREVEQKVFSRIYSEHSQFVMSLGAGFQIASLPKDVRILWYRKKTDADGRIFLNRPRLNLARRPLEEYLERYELRQRLYADFADMILEAPEGRAEWSEDYLEFEKKFLESDLPNMNAYFSILPEHLEPRRATEMFQMLKGKGITFEIRDDILSPDLIEIAFAMLNQERLLFSVRDSVSIRDKKQMKAWIERSDEVDWDVQLGRIPEWLQGSINDQWILSNHSHHLSIFDEYTRWPGQLKWSPFVINFRELDRGIQWQASHASQRSFLPRSSDGNWNWLRLYLKNKQKINFIRNGLGTAPDQPTFFEWSASPEAIKGFAGVLGDPIAHSWSPLFHHDFFRKRSMPFYSIRISKDEWDRSMKLLFDLGLKAAAVTAPLKNLVNQFVQPQSSDQSALNSLARTSDGWQAINTDREGFQDSVADLQLLSPIQQGFCVWGGGGTLESIRAILPRAIYFSGRAGLPRENSNSVGKDYAPRVLVWAAGSSDDIKFPPEHWRPQCVLDLSYRDCSMGLEYAQKVGCLYVSGEKMFVQQAIHQQNFWREFLSSEINEDSV